MEGNHVSVQLVIPPVGTEKDHERYQTVLKQRFELGTPEYDAVALPTRRQRSARDEYLQLIFIKLSEINLGQKTRNSFTELASLLRLQNELWKEMRSHFLSAHENFMEYRTLFTTERLCKPPL